ncbi:MAG: penicillin-binding protein [Clostridia bacterium]|nr:penicillin-binding protein [Clostridia bacterium]
MKKIFKVLLFLIFAAALVIALIYGAFALITKDAVLDESKLTNYSRSITVCDADGNEITNASLIYKRKSVNLNDLNKDTVNAFIASEDRTFFKHNGLNYKRMAKALYKNIVSRSFKEGASTISQQLIKNTHLTGEKTIKRKLSEIKLTKELEQRYSKQKILEMYLNTIYFGHNCYGLESAAEFYYGITATNLNLEQSATMAGLLTSPNNYSPFKNAQKCEERRNIVLKSMQTCGYIDNEEYKNAVNSPLSAEKNQDIGTDDYLTAVFDELEDIGIDYYSLSGGSKIKTFLDVNLQKHIENLTFDSDNSVIIISAKGGVKAYKSTIGSARRQPGSTIKPLLVYAPAIEEKLLYPDTKILDEKVNYSGYSPENYDKNYHGYVTVAQSIANSYNIPAVKTLNALTLDRAEKYAAKMGIKLENDEKNLSLALGGMKYGLTLKDICDRYSTFTNNGNYGKSHFINEIIAENGKVIYKAENTTQKVFSIGTCSLMNDMLLQTAKSGTAKKLKNIPFDVAAKTGTCGNLQGNTDAYCIAYTSEDCIGVWLGDKDNTPLNITGGNNCTQIAESILNKLYEVKPPAPLNVTSGTTTIKIDRDEYTNNNKIILADRAAPMLKTKEIKVIKGSEPKLASTRFSCPTIEKPTINVKNNAVFISLCQTEYYVYLIERESNGQKIQVYNGEWINNFCDEVEDGNYVYYVTPCYCGKEKTYYGKTIKLPAVNIGTKTQQPQQKIPDIIHWDWYNE